jgi:hypothetical protein
MGKIEEKIKNSIMQELFGKTSEIYEFLETRYQLDDKTRSEIIAKLNTLNNDISSILKDTKLS